MVSVVFSLKIQKKIYCFTERKSILITVLLFSLWFNASLLTLKSTDPVFIKYSKKNLNAYDFNAPCTIQQANKLNKNNRQFGRF